MMGDTTARGSACTRANSGSSHWTLHSQWLSRNVNVGLRAASTPRSRDRIRPCRSVFLKMRTFSMPSTIRPCSATQCSCMSRCREPYHSLYTRAHLRSSLKSSIRRISSMRWGGERSKTERTVRYSVDRASLWKQIITVVEGKFWGYVRPWQLVKRWHRPPIRRKTGIP